MDKLKALTVQFIKFGGVGVLCTVIDFGILYLLKEYAGMSSVIAAGISFSVSVIVNYLLSIAFVFKTNKNHSKLREFIVFIVLSIIGLGINELIMWIGDVQLGFNTYIVKIGATAVVTVYNFITRKLTLE